MRSFKLFQSTFLVTGCAALLALGLAGYANAQPTGGQSCNPTADGSNPCPRKLHVHTQQPLSTMATVGKAMFFDPALSGSGKLSCASCHVPSLHYGPAGNTSVFMGGVTGNREGRREIPSLTYLERQPPFSIGPDDAVADDVAPTIAVPVGGGAHAAKSASNTVNSATNLVPQGGLFLDGRADTLHQQASGPMFDPDEMAGLPEKVTARLQTADYAAPLRDLAGVRGRKSSDFLLSEGLFALARYQIEDQKFHSYSSKFDSWLQGKARFSPIERQGYLLFNDPQKGNCAACHVDTVRGDGLPPLFTDHQYEALAAPRNPALTHTRDASYYDLGVCDQKSGGRKDLAPYCGMFATPTLRNVATRHTFFHNGVFHSLEDVMDFYVMRDLEPGRFYPRGPDGKVQIYNDIPTAYQGNIDKSDAPFDRKPGEKPALNEAERKAIIAFLQTLTDGWKGDVAQADGAALSQKKN
ncbi:cytochrome-c peroxidase [Acetobacter cibinongensis]|uniref:Cytochrome c peroxidase/methylamine utilization protein MauG n=1 Tax=Acetobacter cibinongensis TaxID=146475 RepID=A0A0D6N3U1_9PROT|nr:cytochrome c peroxidase [Acetobacter cibinongensis]GAN60624.1 cytochrome c peroxidase/methylamine utilization protein MauG [Acetobacter cibinongensis]GEL59764.1 cytochrome-c peroxidase [Acetobacter cibinongensis]